MSAVHGTGEPLDDIVDFLEPFVGPLIERINVDEFTTVEFIEAMQLDEPTRQAYEAALRHWPEPDEYRAKMIIHGQAIPLLLRQSGLVDWAGFAYGEQDEYAIPAWWRKRSPSRVEGE